MTELSRALQQLNTLLESVQADLEKATEDSILDAVPGIDLRLRDAFLRAEGARRWATLHKAPAYAPYDPATLVRTAAGELAAPATDREEDAPLELEGDAAMLGECLRLVARNMRLTGHGSIYTAYYTDVDIPFVAITFDGEGELQQPLELGPGLTLALGDFNQRWIAGTGGGATQAQGNGLRLYFEGDYPAPRDEAIPEEVIDTLKRAASHLQAWRGAIGHYDEGLAGKAETLGLYKSLTAKATKAIQAAQGV